MILLKKGDRVRITKGDFVGHLGTIRKIEKDFYFVDTDLGADDVKLDYFGIQKVEK